MDLGTFINKSGCECLNESDDYHLPAALAKGPDYLESDCDEQVQQNKLSCVFSPNFLGLNPQGGMGHKFFFTMPLDCVQPLLPPSMMYNPRLSFFFPDVL